jgi:hypothetical protein
VSRFMVGVGPSSKKKWAYAGNDHRNEDVGHNQSVSDQSGSLMNQNHMSNG